MSISLQIEIRCNTHVKLKSIFTLNLFKKYRFEIYNSIYEILYRKFIKWSLKSNRFDIE